MLVFSSMTPEELFPVERNIFMSSKNRLRFRLARHSVDYLPR